MGGSNAASAAAGGFVRPKWPPGHTWNDAYARDMHADARDGGLLKPLLTSAAAAAARMGGPFTGNWLEVGCGPGGFLPTLHRTASTVTGLDVGARVVHDAAAIDRHAGGSGTRVMRARAERIPFRDGAFDGVVALETLEHVDERVVLPELARVLAPGGRLVWSVPVETGSALLVRQGLRGILARRNPNYQVMPYSRKELLAMTFGGDVRMHEAHREPSPFHHLRFSWRALSSAVERAGFRVTRVSFAPFGVRGPWTFSAVGVAVKAHHP